MRNTNFQNGKVLVKLAAFCMAFIVIAGYALWETRHVVAGPTVSISSPQNGATLNNPLVTVSGSAANVAYISLNDRQIFVDNNGNFSQQLLLEPGYNVWQISAKDKFGRTITKTIQLVLNKS